MSIALNYLVNSIKGNELDVPLHQHWHDIHVRRWIVFLTAIIASVAAYFGSLLMTPVFEAKTTFFLAANAVPTAYVGPQPDAPQQPLFPVPEEKAASLDIGILRGEEMMSRLATAVNMPRADLEKQMDVTVSNEFMIDVYVRNPDPERASEIANRVPVVYTDFHRQSMRKRASDVAAALSARRDKLIEERAALRDRLQVSRTESLSTADRAALAQFQNERATAQIELDALKGRLDQASARQATLKIALIDEAKIYRDGQTIDTTTALDGMLERVLELQVNLTSDNFGPTSPQRVAIEEQIAAIQAAMETERQRLADAISKPQGSLYESLRLELVLASAEIAELTAAQISGKSRLDTATIRFENVLAAVGQNDTVSESLAQISAQITTVAANLASAQLQAQNASAPIVVVSKATPPTRPSFPLPILNAIVAGLCGLIFGTYYALYLAHADRGRQVRRSEKTKLPYFSSDEIEQLRKAGQ